MNHDVFLTPDTRPPTSDAPLFKARSRGRRSGWHIGIVLGVLFGLLSLPPVRYTLSGQLAFAFAEDSIPWMRALETRNVAREIPRLNTAAASVPGDYLLQIGRATALASEPTKSGANTEEAANEQTLKRLATVARDFPLVPGAYAHLARYMMSSRIRIRRGEVDSHYPLAASPDLATKPDPMPSLSPERQSALLLLPGDSPRARKRDIQIMEWALRTGESRDADNAFWPTMRATAYFAANRDKEALAALQRASRKSEWNAYIHEEVLGQWRLYSAAYGDNGAAQKIAPLSLVAFPHLLEIRRAAEMARWSADRAVAAGRIDEAVRIRRSVAWIGIRMRETARWSLEALCGADVLLIISTDSGGENRPVSILNRQDWEKQAANYIALLEKRHLAHEVTWLREEAENARKLRAQVDFARYDSSYPGMPPGIPLVPLFGNWIISVCLLQQMMGLSAAALLAALCRRIALPGPLRPLLRFAALGGAFIFGTLLLTGLPTSRLAIGLVLCLTALALFAMEGLGNIAVRRRENKAKNREQETENREQGTEQKPIQNPESRIQNPPSPFVKAERRWRAATTARMLALLLPPGALLLCWLRPELSFLHPVATLLMSVMGNSRVATPADALSLALMACGLPVAFLLLAGLWALYRGVSPLAGVAVGLRRSVFPALACLSLLYLAMLDWTLQLDAAASRGISEVAQNDLQWVLTHSSPPDADHDE